MKCHKIDFFKVIILFRKQIKATAYLPQDDDFATNLKPFNPNHFMGGFAIVVVGCLFGLIMFFWERSYINNINRELDMSEYDPGSKIIQPLKPFLSV